jgi:hypothetical protein
MTDVVQVTPNDGFLPKVDLNSNDFIAATINSLFMILVTEIGDKTFFIAAVLAMRHGRLIVYAGAMGKESPNFGKKNEIRKMFFQVPWL